jgi:hypothetical protein
VILLEMLPIRFLVLSIVLLVIAGAIFQQVNFFLNFAQEKNFRDDIKMLVSKIDFVSGKGSVLKSVVNVPSNGELIIDINNNKIIAGIGTKRFFASTSKNLISYNGQDSGNVSFLRGSYLLSLCYYCDEEKNMTLVIG